jgi:hypothetical protein
MPCHASIGRKSTFFAKPGVPTMTMSAADSAEVQSPARVPLVLWVGIGVYALFLLSGDRLLIDPDTLWQITVGQWIVDHRAVPVTDVYSFTMRGRPWISTQWLAQVLYAVTYAVAGWAGGAGGERDRGDLRIAGAATAPAFQRQHHTGVRRCGSGVDAAASGGAAARAGDAGDGGMGRRSGIGDGPAYRAVVLAAAADDAVG